MKTKKLLSATLALTLLLTGSLGSVGNVYASTKVTQGPGPVKPLDVKTLAKFAQTEGWTLNGAKINSNGTVQLTGNVATLSKEFSYATWDYSDLSIQVKELSEGMTWKLSVKGSETGSKEMVIQDTSKAANSKYGEAFKYSLEGIAGAEAGSNWNDERVKEKTFTLTLTLTGKANDQITLGELKAIKPNYTIPEALPSNVKGTYGDYNFDGDPKLDVETLKNDDPGLSTSKQLNEHQWASLPYSRVVINPGWEFDQGTITGVNPNLDLRFGAYYGINGNANFVAHPEGKSGIQDSWENSNLSIDGTAFDVNSIKSAWYPHKLERSATVTGKGDVSLIDFMIDNNTVGRIIDFDSETGNLNIGVSDSNRAGGAKGGQHNLKASWDAENKVVIKTDNLVTPTDLFFQAMKVVALNEDGSYNKELTAKITEPVFDSTGKGKYIVPSEVKKIGLAIGYANREEGKDVAIERALKNTVNGNIVKSYNHTKDYWNELLRKVPVPKNWGITDTNIKGYDTVTEDEHRVLYYSGYVFNLINTLGVTPETGYNYTQQSLGKPSRQTGGAKMTPANNCWEGVLQIQNIMYVDPSAAWSGMEGFMAMVDANGFLNGEVLPVRMAQTIWMVHTISPDKARLQELYPALARHLKYKISDPRWMYGNEPSYNETDQEYVTSWLNDVRYMIEICKELGGEYAKDVKMWEEMYQKYLANYADWFFSDPMSHEAIGSYPTDGTNRGQTLRNGAGLPTAMHQRGLWTRIFHKAGDVDDVLAFKDACANNTDEGPHYAHSNKGGHVISPKPGRYPREWLQVILSGLIVQDIPTKELKQLMQLMLDVNNPALSNAGLENLKWAPSSFIVYGLINRGFYDEAKNQLDAYLVKTVDVWEFCENYKHEATGPFGTSPTSFGASQIIELTMIKNGAMNDGTGVRAIENWDEGMNKAKNPDVNFYLEGEYDAAQVKLPAEVTQVYEVENFNGEKYTLNKVTAVKWDADSMTQEGNTYFIKGETETHDEIIAKVYTHVTEDALKDAINNAKEVAATYEGKEDYYAKDAYENLTQEIADAEALLKAETKTTEEIGKAIAGLEAAVEAYVESPLVALTEEVKAFVAEIDTDDYKQEDIDAINALVSKVEDSVASKNLTVKEVEALYKELSEGFEAFKAAKIERLPWTPIEPSKPIEDDIEWTPLEPSKPIDKEDKPDTSDATAIVMVAGTLMLAAAGMVLLRKKEEN